MKLENTGIQYLTEATHQGQILLFGLDGSVVKYCVKRSDEQAVHITGYELTQAKLAALRSELVKTANFDIGNHLDDLVDKPYPADAKQNYLDDVGARLGAEPTKQHEQVLVAHAVELAYRYWSDWTTLPLAAAAVDQSVVDHEQPTHAIARSVYASVDLTAAARVQAVSAGTDLVVFRQSVTGTLLADRFVLDVEAGRLSRKLEVRFRRSREKHAPLTDTSGKRLIDTRDFRDTQGRLFYEPTTELPIVGPLSNGGFSVVRVPTIDHDRCRWHIFWRDASTAQIRITSIAGTDEQLFDIDDHTMVEGDAVSRSYRRVPGVMRRSLTLDGLSTSGSLTATAFNLQREINDADGQPALARTGTRVLLAAPTDDAGKIAAFVFAVHLDGSLAQIDTQATNTSLHDRSEELLLPSSVLDHVRAYDATSEDPLPDVVRRGLCFDGLDERVQSGSVIDLQGRSFTIEGWMRRKTDAFPDYLVGQGGVANSAGLHIGFRGPGDGSGPSRFTFAFYADDINTANAYTDLDWHHWACTFELGSRKRVIYRDGVKVAEDTAAKPFLGPAAALLIGRAPWTSACNAEISDLRVWSVARSQAGIVTTMNHRLSGRELGLVANWPLDAVLDGRCRNLAVDQPDATVTGAYCGSRSLSQQLGSGATASGYRNPELFAVAARATYEQSFDLRSNATTQDLQFRFWGRADDDSTTVPVLVDAEIIPLTDGWLRAKARFTVPERMTHLRSFDITRPTGSWTELKLRNHRVAKLAASITEARYDDSVSLQELGSGYADIERLRGNLAGLERREAQLLQRQRALALALDTSQAAVRDQQLASARTRRTQLAQTAADRATLASLAEQNLSNGSVIALEGGNGQGYLTVDGDYTKGGASDVGSHEKLVIEAVTNQGDSIVRYGDIVALRAHTSKYLLADNPSWPASHYYWGNTKYDAIGAYERLVIVDHANPLATGPVPRGASVAFRSLRSDYGSKYLLCGSSGTWTHKVWFEHDLPHPDGRFTARLIQEASSVQKARDALAVAQLELAACQAELDALEAAIDQANNDRAAAELEQSKVEAELVTTQQQLSGQVTSHLDAVRQLEGASVELPTITGPAAPLPVKAALLGFARASGHVSSHESLVGGAELNFFGTDGRRRTVTYDAIDERWEPDAPGTCLRIDGNGPAQIPHHAAYTLDAYTLELWFQHRGRSTDIEFLIGKGMEEMEIHTAGNGVPGALRFIPVPGVYLTTRANTVLPGEWVHVACVYTGTAATSQIYLNGVKQDVERHIQPRPHAGTTAPLLLGRRANNTFPLHGHLQELRLWNVALPEWEIQAMMHDRLRGHEPGLVGCWPLRGTDSASYQLTDVTPNHNHGTRGAGPIWQPSTAPVANMVHTVSRCSGSGPILEAPALELANRSFTVEAWARRAAPGRTDMLLGQGQLGTNACLHVGFRNNDQFTFAFYYNDLDTPAETDRGWHHWACTFDHASGRRVIYRDGVQVAQSTTTAYLGQGPITIGAGSWPASISASAFLGELAELRIWAKARTKDEIRRDMYMRATGSEPSLLHHQPLDGGQPSNAQLVTSRSLPLVPADAVLAREYDSVELTPNGARACLRRLRAWLTPTAIEMIMGARVDVLEVHWLGNAQLEPTLVGYIEGPPPIPSENLVSWDAYNGQSYYGWTHAELKFDEESETTLHTESDVGTSYTMQVAKGIEMKGELGIAFIADIAKEFEISVAETFGAGWSAGSTLQQSRTSTSIHSTSEKIELTGDPEPELAATFNVGRRWVPKNVGYATVVSTLADVWVVRLAGSKRMLSSRLTPVEGMPPEVNTLTFLINPAYTLAGSLDGQVGSQPADERLYGHVPSARAQYGSLVPASYFRIAEARALEDAIDRRNRSKEAVEVNFHSASLEAANRRAIDKYASQQTPSQLPDENDVGQAADAERQSTKDLYKQIRAARPIEEIAAEAPKGNIVNSYVWDGDGGLRSETRSFASSWETVFGGNVSYDVSFGAKATVKALILAELDHSASLQLAVRSTAASTQKSAVELNIKCECENGGITNAKDEPLQPGEKVDRYRFKSFALQPSTEHFKHFFAEVVDPVWLRSNDEEALTLRRIDQTKPNKTWRVLHRVTYVERPGLMKIGE